MRFVAAGYWDVDATLRPAGVGRRGVRGRGRRRHGDRPPDGTRRPARGERAGLRRGERRAAPGRRRRAARQRHGGGRGRGRAARHLRGSRSLRSARTRSDRRRRSSPPPSSRRRATSCGSPRSAPWGPRRASTKTATSPTCAPTPPASPRRRSTPRGRRSPRSTGRSTCPTAPASTPPAPAAHRRPHEAIRPAGERFRTPASVRAEMDGDRFRLYELIWQRTVASQMRDATGLRTNVRLEADAGDHGTAVFAASGKVITFPGFLRAYVEGSDDPDARAGRPGAAAAAALARAEPGRDHHAGAGARDAAAGALLRSQPRAASWKSWASAARPRTRPSSRRSCAASTPGRRAPRWCRAGSPSRSCSCWSNTSANS